MRNSVDLRLRDVRLQPPPIARLIGFEPVELESGRAVFRLEVDPARHANPMGTVHGGMLCDLAHAAGKLVARASGTCMTPGGRQAEGR